MKLKWYKDQGYTDMLKIKQRLHDANITDILLTG